MSEEIIKKVLKGFKGTTNKPIDEIIREALNLKQKLFDETLNDFCEELKEELRGKFEYNGHLVAYEFIEKLKEKHGGKGRYKTKVTRSKHGGSVKRRKSRRKGKNE